MILDTIRICSLLVDEITLQRTPLYHIPDWTRFSREQFLVFIVYGEITVEPQIDITLGDGLIEDRIIKRLHLRGLVPKLAQPLQINLGIKIPGVPRRAARAHLPDIAGSPRLV